MDHVSAAPAALAPDASSQEVLRFITCGSVDDGKSTLIGRLLYESKSIFEDQLAALARESKQYGTQGERLDLALLVDGLQAEREQGITIDVAYRFFSTARRRYIVADCPGHEQYTRNMATAASTADAAVLLVDSTKGLLAQTRRHSRIASMMGIRHILVAVNKLDMIGFDPTTFHAIAAAYREFAAPLGFASIEIIPVSGLDGDNVISASQRTPWYDGLSLLDTLDRLAPDAVDTSGPLRMPVQWINRPNMHFRGICGRIANGRIRPGDAVRILPSGVQTQVKSVLRGFSEVQEAMRGDSVSLTFASEVDASRGDVVVAAEGATPEVSDQFEAKLLWLSATRLMPGRQYIMKLGTREVTATVTAIKYLEDVDSGRRLAARTMALNEIATVNVSTSAPLAFEPYSVNRLLGAFILIDKLGFETAGAGMIGFALHRAANIQWQALEIDKDSRAASKHQKPVCLWFTGLSGSGKSTVANLVEKRLHALGRHTYLLDGDNIRHGLSRDLGFTDADRVENIRRVGEVARLMVDAGLIVLVSFISPFRTDRQMARELFAEGDFLEVFVDAPLADCERRDTKGLYAKARKGLLHNFTGIDSPYEPPEAPDMHLLTSTETPEACVERVLRMLDGNARLE